MQSEQRVGCQLDRARWRQVDGIELEPRGQRGLAGAGGGQANQALFAQAGIARWRDDVGQRVGYLLRRRQRVLLCQVVSGFAEIG